MYLEHFDGVQHLVQTIQHGERQHNGLELKYLLEDNECRSEFLKFDVWQLKAQSVKSMKSLEFVYTYESPIANENEYGIADEGDDDPGEECYGEDDETPFSCERHTISGETCGQKLATRQALLLHQKWSKKHDPLWDEQAYVLTNQCPNCSTTLASYPAALQHIRLSAKKGFCKTHRNIIKTDVKTPAYIYCIVCDHEFQDLETYNAHVSSTHLGHIGEVSSDRREGPVRQRAKIGVQTYVAIDAQATLPDAEAESGPVSTPPSTSASLSVDQKVRLLCVAATDSTHSASATPTPAKAVWIPKRDLDDPEGDILATI